MTGRGSWPIGTQPLRTGKPWRVKRGFGGQTKNIAGGLFAMYRCAMKPESSDVILCGHSYGGCVISGAADQIPDRIRALIYLDAVVLEDGECLFDLMPQEWAQDIRQQTQVT